MAVSSLREITVGVQDLKSRVIQFERGCGLSGLTAGRLTSMTASRLFETHVVLDAAVLGRPDAIDALRIRLVECGDARPLRTGGLESPGPLGVVFSTRGISEAHARLQECGVQFLSPPLPLPKPVSEFKGVAPGPQRLEAFGRGSDGDFVVLSESVSGESSPDEAGGRNTSEPRCALFIVTNLDACVHFMRDVFEHETLFGEKCSGAPFDSLLGLGPEVGFRLVTAHRPGSLTGHLAFMEFEKRPQPMAQLPSLARGMCRLRYDTTDLHATLSRVPGGGGSLVRGPASVDDPVLGNGLVAMVRAPFGVLIELWQTQ